MSNFKKNNLNLRGFCSVAEDGKHGFVGIKISENEKQVKFPIGYRLSDDDDACKKDILSLIKLLAHFEKKTSELKDEKIECAIRSRIIPCLQLYKMFLYSNCTYYIEKEKKYLYKTTGKIDWGKTIKKIKPLVNKRGTVFFNEYIVQKKDSCVHLLTSIHKYCVYEAYKEIGWLFSPFCPEKSDLKFNKKLFLSVLKNKLSQTFNDNDKLLFKTMIKIIEEKKDKSSSDEMFYGTEDFYVIWEKVIDSIFGDKKIKKTDYYPHVTWHVDKSFSKEKNLTMRPDTIMCCEGVYYILDAKYYGLENLPDSYSVTKQIAYGDYARKKIGKDSKIYNAFLMPYDLSENENKFQNIGYAESDFTKGREKQEYFKIKGIVIDTRSLLSSYNKHSKDVIEKLAKCIQEEKGNDEEYIPIQDCIDLEK